MPTGERGHVHCFPYNEEDPTGPLRTNAQLLQYAHDALESGLPVRITFILYLPLIISDYVPGIWCEGPIMASYRTIV